MGLWEAFLNWLRRLALSLFFFFFVLILLLLRGLKFELNIDQSLVDIYIFSNEAYGFVLWNVI